MMEFLKKYSSWILGGILILLLIAKFQGCGKPIDGVIIKPDDVSENELNKIKKVIPDARKAVKFTPPTANPGKKIDTTVVVKNNGEILVINTEKIKVGFTLNYGIYGGYNSVPNLGLKVGFFQVGRVWADALVGYDSANAGVSYQITNNSYIGGGYGYSYVKFMPLPLVYFSFGF